MNKKNNNLGTNSNETLNALEEPLFQIDEAIPLEEQRRYFIARQALNKRKIPLSPQKLKDIEALIYNKKMGENWHRNTLVQLSTSGSVEAYRILEDFRCVAPRNLHNWSVIAEFDARVALHSQLGDLEEVTVISTGLGGRGNLLRFCAICATYNWVPFEEYQEKLCHDEFSYAITVAKGIVEQSLVGNGYIIVTFLIPLGTDPHDVLSQAINACNEIGDFMDAHTLRTTNISPIREQDIEHMRKLIEKENNEELSI